MTRKSPNNKIIVREHFRKVKPGKSKQTRIQTSSVPNLKPTGEVRWNAYGVDEEEQKVPTGTEQINQLNTFRKYTEEIIG